MGGVYDIWLDFIYETVNCNLLPIPYFLGLVSGLTFLRQKSDQTLVCVWSDSGEKSQTRCNNPSPKNYSIYIYYIHYNSSGWGGVTYFFEHAMPMKTLRSGFKQIIIIIIIPHYVLDQRVRVRRSLWSEGRPNEGER
jgi:hypothetical protein